MFITAIITYAVTAAVWLTPMPAHASGLITLYDGSPEQHLVQANAAYHGYLFDARYACGGSLMPPHLLGQTFWVRIAPTAADPDPAWFGPCLSVDASARKDFANNAIRRHEIAEIDLPAADFLDFPRDGRGRRAGGVIGEVFVGDCPGRQARGARPYFSEDQPFTPQMVDWADPGGDRLSYLSYFWPFPAQAEPQGCLEIGLSPGRPRVRQGYRSSSMPGLGSRPK